MSEQLPLGIALRDSAAFENFYPGPNQAAVAAVRGMTPPGVYLWGAPGTGKTHLLQAACAAALQQGSRAAYLPLREAARFSPDMLQGWEDFTLVCLDDLDAVAGNTVWEQALFHLYNGVRDAGGCLQVAAAAAPAQGSIALADLRSRLSHAPVYQLQALDDAGKLVVLQQRAARRGFELPDDTAQYLLSRYQRDMHSLCNLLDVLDTASLAAQRKLTIPFVRNVLPGGREGD